MTLSEKRIVYSNASGRNVIRYEEKHVREFIKKLNEIKGDDLAMWYKEHEKCLENLSPMEICNGSHDCDDFVIEKIKERIDKLAGDTLTKGIKELGK